MVCKRKGQKGGRMTQPVGGAVGLLPLCSLMPGHVRGVVVAVAKGWWLRYDVPVCASLH